MANGIILRPLDFSLVTSSTTALGYKASNVGEDRMGLVWKSSNNATENLVIDLGADTAFDTITLHGLEGATASWQVTIEIATAAQGKFTGSYWSDSAQDLLAGATAPVGRGRGIWQAPAGAPSSARYIRLAFSALDAAIQVGRVCVGAKIVFGRNFRLGAALGIRPTGSVSFNNRGTMIRRSGVQLRGVGISYSGLTKAEVEGAVMPLLERVGNDKPVVIVTDPDADAERQNRIYYGVLTGDLGAIWAQVGDKFTSSFNLVALD